MNASRLHVREHRLRAALDDPHVRVGLLAAAAPLVEAVLAKSVLDLPLNFFAQLAALWVFVAYKLRDRLAEMSASVAVVAVTATVMLIYAL